MKGCSAIKTTFCSQ